MRDLMLQLGYLLAASGGIVAGWAVATGQFRLEPPGGNVEPTDVPRRPAATVEAQDADPFDGVP